MTTSSGADSSAFDVVIVGGGIVGLAAAQELSYRYPGTCTMCTGLGEGNCPAEFTQVGEHASSQMKVNKM